MVKRSFYLLQTQHYFFVVVLQLLNFINHKYFSFFKLKDKYGALQIYFSYFFSSSQYSTIFLFMNFANYSPYNKSYRFICFQNQAYHQKNKRNASPCIRTNLRYSLNKSYDNPQGFSERRSQSSHKFSRLNNSDMTESPPQSPQLQSSMLRSTSLSNAVIKQNKRVIHKHKSFEKFKMKKIVHQNSEIVNRLIQAQCQVVKKQQTQRSFFSHLKYRDIRKKYSEHGVRKTKMVLGNSSLLCPTLQQYNESGLAQKFVQLDLSMSMAPSSPTTKMRKRRSDFQRRNEVKNEV